MSAELGGSARDAMMTNFKTIMLSDGNAAITQAEHDAALTAFYNVFGDVDGHRHGHRRAGPRAPPRRVRSAASTERGGSAPVGSAALKGRAAARSGSGRTPSRPYCRGDRR